MNTKIALKITFNQFIGPKTFFTYIYSYPYSNFTDKECKGQKYFKNLVKK